MARTKRNSTHTSRRLSRRHFAQLSGVLASGASAACGSEGGASTSDDPNSPISPSETGGATSNSLQGTGGSSGGAGGAHTCGDVTATNIEGPFFLEGSPERTDIRDGAAGARLRLTGCVLGPDCAPVSNALVDFWQADDAGDYDTDGDTFRGHQYTDEEGQFILETIVPGRYLNGDEFRPAHIHVKVSAGGETLTTQLYFPGDPYNDVDAFIEESLIMEVTEEGEDLLGRFDFTLRTV